MISLFFKCLLGALTVLVIALLSKTRGFFIAGLAPLFPTFASIALLSGMAWRAVTQ